jgi:hypothetical protein
MAYLATFIMALYLDSSDDNVVRCFFWLLHVKGMEFIFENKTST